MILVNYYFIILCLFSCILPNFANNRISNQRRCVNEDCSVPISLAKTRLRYSADDYRILSFPRNVVATIFSKEAGDIPTFWEGEIKGKRGYIPKDFLTEYKVLQNKESVNVIVSTGRDEKKEINTVQDNVNKSSITPTKNIATPDLPVASSKGFFGIMGGVSADSVPPNSPDIKPQTTERFQVIEGTTVYEDGQVMAGQDDSEKNAEAPESSTSTEQTVNKNNNQVPTSQDTNSGSQQSVSEPVNEMLNQANVLVSPIDQNIGSGEVTIERVPDTDKIHIKNVSNKRNFVEVVENNEETINNTDEGTKEHFSEDIEDTKKDDNKIDQSNSQAQSSESSSLLSGFMDSVPFISSDGDESDKEIDDSPLQEPKESEQNNLKENEERSGEKVDVENDTANQDTNESKSEAVVLEGDKKIENGESLDQAIKPETSSVSKEENIFIKQVAKSSAGDFTSENVVTTEVNPALNKGVLTTSEKEDLKLPQDLKSETDPNTIQQPALSVETQTLENVDSGSDITVNLETPSEPVSKDQNIITESGENDDKVQKLETVSESIVSVTSSESVVVSSSQQKVEIKKENIDEEQKTTPFQDVKPLLESFESEATSVNVPHPFDNSLNPEFKESKVEQNVNELTDGQVYDKQEVQPKQDIPPVDVKKFIPSPMPAFFNKHNVPVKSADAPIYSAVATDKETVPIEEKEVVSTTESTNIDNTIEEKEVVSTTESTNIDNTMEEKEVVSTTESINIDNTIDENAAQKHSDLMEEVSTENIPTSVPEVVDYVSQPDQVQGPLDEFILEDVAPDDTATDTNEESSAGIFLWFDPIFSLFSSPEAAEEEVINQNEQQDTVVPENTDYLPPPTIPEESCQAKGFGEESCDTVKKATEELLEETSWHQSSIQSLFSMDSVPASLELVGNIPLETTIWLIITAVVVLIFSLGHYYIEAHRRDGPLVAVINKLEREVLILKKESSILDDRLQTYQSQLEAWNTSSSENDALIVELKQELEETKTAKAELEEQLAVLEKEVETVTESGLEMHRLLSESLSSQDGSQVLLTTVETLREKLEHQEDEISGLSQSLALKSAEVEELKEKLKEAGEVATGLEDKIISVTREKDEESLELKDKHRQLIAQLEEVMEVKALDETRVSMEMSKLRLTIEDLQRSLVEKESELEEVKEVVKELRSTDSNEKMDALFDVVAVKAQLKAASVERDDFREKFLEEEGARKLLEGHMKKITQEVAELKNSFETAEKEKIEALTKLQVLSDYFKEKEGQLQKELGVHESMWLQKQSEDHTIYEQMRSLREENEKFKLQNESLKKEIVEQEASFKIQLANVEQKSHENWVASRQAERRLKEVQQEAGQLRNRLTMEKSANFSSLDDSKQMNESNGDPSSPPPSLIYPPTTSPPFMIYPHMPPPGDFVPPPPLLGSPYPSDSRPPPLGRISSPPLDHRFSPPPPYPPYESYPPYGHHSPSPPPPLPPYTHHRNVHKPQPREMPRDSKDHSMSNYSPETEKPSRRNKR